MGQLDDKIEDLEDEVTTLREVRDDLMEENERLWGLVRGLEDKLRENAE